MMQTIERLYEINKEIDELQDIKKYLENLFVTNMGDKTEDHYRVKDYRITVKKRPIVITTTAEYSVSLVKVPPFDRLVHEAFLDHGPLSDSEIRKIHEDRHGGFLYQPLTDGKVLEIQQGLIDDNECNCNCDCCC